MPRGGFGAEAQGGEEVGPRVPQAMRRLLLDRQGRNYILAHFNPAEDRVAGAPFDDDINQYWQVRYDTKLLALERQDVSLRERAGSWELMVPSIPERGASLLRLGLPKTRRRSLSGRRTFTSDKEILRLLGADDDVINSEVSIAQKFAACGLRPIARLHISQSFFRVELPPAGQNGETSIRQLVLVLEDVDFDTAHAEPAHLSMLLEKYGDQMRKENMRAAFLEIRVALSTDYARATTDERALQETRARQQVKNFLRVHGLDEKGGSCPKASVLVAYMRACRPSHLSSLEQAGLMPELVQEDDSPLPTSRTLWGDSKDDGSDEDDTVYHI